jgi:superfamily II helicase
MEEIKTKVCKRCGKEAPITEFSKHKGCKDGHHIYCKTCRNEMAKQYYHDRKARMSNNTSGGGNFK